MLVNLIVYEKLMYVATEIQAQVSMTTMWNSHH